MISSMCGAPYDICHCMLNASGSCLSRVLLVLVPLGAFGFSLLVNLHTSCQCDNLLVPLHILGVQRTAVAFFCSLPFRLTHS